MQCVFIGEIQRYANVRMCAVDYTFLWSFVLCEKIRAVNCFKKPRLFSFVKPKNLRSRRFRFFWGL